MAESPPTQPLPPTEVDQRDSIEIEIRVRYPECDPAGVAYHGAFPTWLELARTELLRRNGTPYAALEADGVKFVVARLCIRYRRPVRYDELIRVRTWIATSARAKVDHEYEIHAGPNLVATAQTTLVCVDAANRPRPIPDGVMSVSPAG